MTKRERRSNSLAAIQKLFKMSQCLILEKSETRLDLNSIETQICENRLRIQREIPEISRGTIYFTSIFSKRIDRNNVVDSMNAALFHYRKSKMSQPKWRIVKIGKLHCHYLMRKRPLKNIGRVLLTAISQTPLFANSSNRSLFLIMKG